jgi:hypothetical protein
MSSSKVHNNYTGFNVSHRLSANMTQVVTYCIPTTALYLTSRQGTCVHSQCHSVCRVSRVAKYLIRWNSMTVTMQTFGKLSESGCLPHKPLVGTVRQLSTWLIEKCTVVGAFVTSDIPVVETRLKNPFQYYIHLSTRGFSV